LRARERSAGEHAGEVAPNLDDRVPGCQQRRIAAQQRVGRVGVRLGDVALEQRARVGVQAGVAGQIIGT